MLSKDAVKELLFDDVGFNSREEKNALGKAAADILCYFADAALSAGQPVMLESNFETAAKPGLIELINKHDCPVLTVMLTTELNTLYRRFIERDRSIERHRGHVVNTVYPEKPGEKRSIEEQGIGLEGMLKAFTDRGMLDFDVGGERIVVDTTDFAKVNYEDIAGEIIKRIGID
jgi:hypothetical protein